MKNIAKQVARARKRADLTQAEAARRAKISRQHFWKIETGEIALPQLATLDAIAKALNMKLVVELRERGA